MIPEERDVICEPLLFLGRFLGGLKVLPQGGEHPRTQHHLLEYPLLGSQDIGTALLEVCQRDTNCNTDTSSVAIPASMKEGTTTGLIEFWSDNEDPEVTAWKPDMLMGVRRLYLY